MFGIETLLFLIGILLFMGIASSKFSARFGMPALVIFLILGMLAGSEGIGGIEFENYSLAYSIGTVSLCFILFDGGLRTPFATIQSAWKPAGALATVGVLITAIVTGLAASWILQISLLEGLLIGSILGSTDAAVVFSVLRSGGVHIRRRLADTLEVESGSNDPMAIFLTVGLIQVLTGEMPLGLGLATLFLNQMVIGVVAGAAIGWAGVWLLKHIELDAAGLYPVLATAFGLLSFGTAALIGGSGFLAVYVSGIVIGNRQPIFQRGILLFHDAVAWICQILMFIALGLLSFPSRLLQAAPSALLISVVLIFVARPLAVWVCAAPFRFTQRELMFLSWVGLKGAVPITLATFPMLAGLPGSALLFDTVFFGVLVSALVQGWTLPTLARYLHLEVAARRSPPVTLEISSLKHVEGDIVEYFVDEHSRADGRMIKDLALPEGVVVAMIARKLQIIPPQGRSKIVAGDHVIVVLRPQMRPIVDKVFSQRHRSETVTPTALEFPLRGSITVADIREFYDISLDDDLQMTLDQLLRKHSRKRRIEVNDTVRFEKIELRVRELSPSGAIEYVGMTISSQ